ncbi:MAG: universal stress protein [Ilumatobacteraceae bacterium]|nr:universal stress protein [Ilumatobacteraceae bacterium]
MPDGAIVVGVDGTVGSHAALFAAINLALATNRPVVVVHVEHNQPIAAAGTAMGFGAGAMIEAEDSFAEVCRTNCADILDAAGVHWTFEIRRGNPADELADAAAEHTATYLVVGRHGHHGLARLLAGSVSQRLLHHARHPLLIIPPPT